LRNGTIEAVYNKMLLPNYGVFDEKRYFSAGERPISIVHNNVEAALTICEDIWDAGGAALKPYRIRRVPLLINISASPYHSAKERMRRSTLVGVARICDAIVIYCNMVGGQDELVFDGASAVVDSRGDFVYRAGRFEEDFGIVEIVSKGPKVLIAKRDKSARQPLQTEEIYASLVLGTHDYVAKNGFSKVVLGLSGGIDSALTAKIACDAVGKSNVIAVSMPSRYSSRQTQEDAKAVARNLGIRLIDIPIQGIHLSYTAALADEFKDLKVDVTEENLQARIRGNILMALSNKFGWLVLTTGNKSEISMGYCTLYGDMAGGFAVIKDVPKTLVYRLADFVNKKASRKIIPESVIRRAPSAELRPDQKDSDTLPPYAVLDPVLRLYIEEEMSLDEIAKKGFDKTLAKDIINRVDQNEYKRRQGPPGIKITPRAFGKDRRFPIVNKYRA
jgi:NAD+ synthase (glutamine-hydrolysing)